MASRLVKKRDQGLVVDAQEADEAVAEQLYRTDAVDQYGAMTLFVESWCSEPTYVGALRLIEEFDLPYPRTETELEKEYSAVHQLFDQLAETLTNKVIRQFNAASELTKIGGIYSVGQNHRNFGLQFSASADEREDLMQALSRKTTAAVQPQVQAGCIRKALQHLRDLDFGRPNDVVPHLTAAMDQLESCGVKPTDIALALKYFTMDPDKAQKFIYGPSGRGSNKGAIVDLTEMLDTLEHGTSTQELRASAPRIIVVGGLRYERVDDDAEVARIVTAAGKKKKKRSTKYPGNRSTGKQRTPKDMNGVMLCKSKDHDDTDPNREKKEQVWCTYDSKGKLRGRHPTKQKAIDHKLFLINMYWTRGRGVPFPGQKRPTNKKRIKAPPRRK